ncbi:unnamed protein product [Rhizoctonia solani]|uniref:Uncharacterized protein n=1 Tax=Rhizoctonia solani TaxID=456999 RepID=A0A8H3C805_9AGAM|nr:unnamed protein product [Rhizoctonia solani]
MSATSASAAHLYPPSACNVTGWASVLPLVGVVTFAASMGLYFSADAVFKNIVQWQPRTQPWLRTQTNSVRWDGTGGVREMVKKEYRAAK